MFREGNATLSLSGTAVSGAGSVQVSGSFSGSSSAQISATGSVSIQGSGGGSTSTALVGQGRTGSLISSQPGGSIQLWISAQGVLVATAEFYGITEPQTVSGNVTELGTAAEMISVYLPEGALTENSVMASLIVSSSPESFTSLVSQPTAKAKRL